MRLFKLLLVVMSCGSLFLSGCGGGGSDSSGTLALTVTAPTAATLPGTASAKYTAVGAKNPIGVEISFSTDRPDLVILDTNSRSVGSDGVATITFTTTTVQTTATAIITASTGGLSTFQTITLQGDANAPPPQPPTATLVPDQIQASISPTDGKLALKGTGTSARPENGFITFKVLDHTTVVPSQVVDFTITPANNGGVTITALSATTNTSGTVTLGISAGSTQTSVQITAKLHSNPAVQAIAQFSITSGPPDQDSFSLAAVTLNSETFNHNGVIIPVTVGLGDHFNNPPPAGTTVIFTTNGGKIDGSGVTDANGNVTVNWRSQDPRPANGRFIILAYAVGEESFKDQNGNGLADPGEFTDTGFAFLDENANGVYNIGEYYIPESNGAAYSTGDGLYNGMYQGAAFTGAPKVKNIFRNIELVMSTDQANITGPASIGGPGDFSVTVTDMHGNTMAAGTTITIASTVGTLSGVTTFTVPQNTGTGVTLPFSIAAGTTPVAKSGSVTITVKSPGGLVTNAVIPIAGLF